VHKPSSVYSRLLELERWVKEQIDLETMRPSYNGTQKAIAYKRVIDRLSPILRQARMVRKQFDFPSISVVDAPTEEEGETSDASRHGEGSDGKTEVRKSSEIEEDWPSTFI
jgi:hypothetical protein